VSPSVRRKSGLTGTVRVYATQMIATTLLPDLLSRNADIGSWISPPEQLDIVSRKLGEFRIMACASQAYLDQHGEPAAIEDLAGHRLLGNDKLDTVTQWLKQAGVPLRRPQFALRADAKAACPCRACRCG